MKSASSRMQEKAPRVVGRAAAEGEGPASARENDWENHRDNHRENERAGDEREGERLHAIAARLHPTVAWKRMSEEAVRRALGLRPASCCQREEYEAGRRSRAEGEVPCAEASMAFRTGWGHGKPPRPRRRRWRSRPHFGKDGAGKDRTGKGLVGKGRRERGA